MCKIAAEPGADGKATRRKNSRFDTATRTNHGKVVRDEDRDEGELMGDGTPRLTRRQMRERGLLDAIPQEATSPIERISQTQEIPLHRRSRKDILAAERQSEEAQQREAEAKQCEAEAQRQAEEQQRQAEERQRQTEAETRAQEPVVADEEAAESGVIVEPDPPVPAVEAEPETEASDEISRVSVFDRFEADEEAQSPRYIHSDESVVVREALRAPETSAQAEEELTDEANLSLSEQLRSRTMADSRLSSQPSEESEVEEVGVEEPEEKRRGGASWIVTMLILVIIGLVLGVLIGTLWLKYVSVSYTHLTLPTILRSCRSRWSPYH